MTFQSTQLKDTPRFSLRSSARSAVYFIINVYFIGSEIISVYQLKGTWIK